MIFEAGPWAVGRRIEVDLTVIGAGPGGLAAATMAAEAGLRVLILEAGGLVTPGAMNQREADMLPRLLWHAGARTNLDQSVRVVQGKGVGGSSLHNLNLCRRIPEAILERWRRDRGLEHLSHAAWSGLYEEVESLLSVSEIPESSINRHNALLRAGTEALGWRGGRLSHNRSGCIGSGYCEVGCAYDAKNNALKVLAPRFVAAEGEVLTRVQAVRIQHGAGGVTGVEAVVLDPKTMRAVGQIEIRCSRVCVSASATATPALLLRSGVPDPSGETGQSLRIHPALMVAGEFEQEVRAWEGIPQSYECTEWLDLDDPEDEDASRIWIVPAFGHPMSVSTMMSGHGPEHRAVMERFAHLACFTAMLHDHTRGRVQPRGDLDLTIDYWPDPADLEQLRAGLVASTRLMFAAGATRVIVPGYPGRTLEAGQDPELLRGLSLEPGRLEFSAAHPMGSVPMGDDPASAAVGSDGRHHHLRGLWVSDGSLFPTSIGVPPQLSIYALGLHVGRQIVARG